MCTVTFITEIKIYFLLVGFEVLTAVVMKSTIFWDIMPCSLLKVNRRFGGTYRLHNHGRIGPAIYQREIRLCCYLAKKAERKSPIYSSTLKMQATCSPETSTFNGLYGVISQKLV
jgi:hypothetical protein